MSRRRSSPRRVLLLLLAFTLAPACHRKDEKQPTGKPKSRHLIVLHTNDLHDHLEDVDGVGGFARLASAVASRRAAAGDRPVLLLDAGDFSMGTPYTLLGPSQAPALVLMGQIGYDAITIGNHDLDWGPAGLAESIASAREHGFDVPIVCSNARFDAERPGDDSLARLRDQGALRAKVVETVGDGLRVGIIGLLGPDAYDVAPDAAPLSFDRSMKEHAERAQKLVDELREVDRVDVVIALAHEGCAPTGEGEACELGRAVHGIDLIVGGHTHVALESPVTAGGAAVVQTSSAGEWLGEVELEIDAKGAVTVVRHAPVRLDDAVVEVPEIGGRVAEYRALLDERLSSYKLGAGASAVSLSRDRALVESAFEVEHAAFREDAIGDLVTDAYRFSVAECAPTSRPEVAIEATGLIRDALRPGADGALRFSDLFQVLPLGRGLDGVVGYPLVTYHLTPRDLRAGLEIAALAANVHMPKLAKYFLQTSGLVTRYRSSALMFQSVQSMALEKGRKLDREDEVSCVRVVSSLRVGELLSTVEKLSHGRLHMTPREADCKTPVSDWRAHLVDADPTTEGVQELKAWHALVRYVASREDRDGDGIPDLPESYRHPQGRFESLTSTPLSEQ